MFLCSLQSPCVCRPYSIEGIIYIYVICTTETKYSYDGYKLTKYPNFTHVVYNHVNFGPISDQLNWNAW